MKQRPMRWEYEVGSTEKCAGRCCNAVVETPCDLHPIKHDRNWPAKTFATVLIGIAHHSTKDYKNGAGQCLTIRRLPRHAWCGFSEFDGAKSVLGETR
jgi:hypothetical protein